jgi:hypothetical protein
MIQIQISESTNTAPILVCDHCGKRITDAYNAAAVVLPNKNYPNGNGTVLHVHKGKCHTAVDLANPETHGWDEMTMHLRLLLKNVGIDLSKLEEEGKIDKQFGLTNE